MSLFTAPAKGDPWNLPFPGQGDHFPHQAGQVVPLFDQGAPCRPHGGLGLGQNCPEPAQIFVTQGTVRHAVHIIWVGGALGIYIEHDPAVKAVGGSKTLHTFKGGVQCAGLCGAGVDADAHQRVPAHTAQHIAVGLVCMGLVIPDAAGIFVGLENGDLFGLHG